MIKKAALGLGVFILLGVFLVFGYFTLALPNVSAAPEIEIELTEERLGRGQYLVEHVAVCLTCHSERKADLFSMPFDSTVPGGGNPRPFIEDGIGQFYAPNLTPHHLGSWTDGEVFRAITAGVDKDGEALFPLMPYPHYALMDREDIYAIIAYLRTLEPVNRDLPDSEIKFPMNLIVQTIPADPIMLQPMPSASNPVRYGEYLTNAASCSSCHTPIDNMGEPLPGMSFAGGFEFPIPTGGTVRSANITPDELTGIGSWTEEMFLARFLAYRPDSSGVHAVGMNEFNTEMPWSAYAGMSEEDIRAIYAYLRTLAPVENGVERFSP